MITEEHISNAIEKTLKGESNLTESIFAIRGFSSSTIRRLINNLTNIECTYLEVGLLCGATFVSSFNKDCTSIGIEDFCENFQEDIPGYDKDELQINIDRHSERAKEVHVHYESFLDIKKELLPNDIDIFLYDGEHGLQNHSVVLPEFFDNMAERFVFLVDDATWPQISDGTGVGFKFLRNKMWIEKTWELRNEDEDDNRWVCGVNIYLIQKKPK